MGCYAPQMEYWPSLRSLTDASHRLLSAWKHLLIQENSRQYQACGRTSKLGFRYKRRGIPRIGEYLSCCRCTGGNLDVSIHTNPDSALFSEQLLRLPLATDGFIDPSETVTNWGCHAASTRMFLRADPHR